MRTTGYDRPPRNERGGQLSLFAGESHEAKHPITTTTPSVRCSATSSTAARRIRQVAGRLERLVFETLQRAGPHSLTDAEIQQRLNLAGDTQRPRRIDLVHGGMVRDGGCRRVTPSGRFAVMWVVVEHAEVAA